MIFSLETLEDDSEVSTEGEEDEDEYIEENRERTEDGPRKEKGRPLEKKNLEYDRTENGMFKCQFCDYESKGSHTMNVHTRKHTG